MKVQAFFFRVTLIFFLLNLISPKNFGQRNKKTTYQKVRIISEPENTIYIGRKKLDSANTIYELPKYKNSIQVTCKRKGFVNDYSIIVQHTDEKYFDSYSIGFEMKKNIPLKTNKDKYVLVSDISIDVKPKDKSLKIISYSNFLNKDDTIKKINERFVIGNYDEKSFSKKINQKKINKSLNGFLNDRGYKDTTNSSFNNPFKENIIIKGVIVGYAFNQFYSSELKTKNANLTYYNIFMNNVEINMKWEIFDVYNNKLKVFETISKSGEFKNFDMVNECFENALQFGLVNLFNKIEFINLLQGVGDDQEEKSFNKITIPKPTNVTKKLSECVKAAVTIKNTNSHGSGFFISNEGHIITNHHLISNNDTNKNNRVILNNGASYEYKVIRVSKIYDLAILKIDFKNEYSYAFSNKNVEIAEEIFAIGTPNFEDLSQTLSKGIISGYRKTSESTGLIQTDASINRGNSGGALINKNLEVIGVIQSKLIGNGIEGLAFGIPTLDIQDKMKIKFD